MPTISFRILTAVAILLLMTLAENAYGQKKKSTDVYLKNKTIVRGHIVVDNDFYVRIVKLNNDTIQIGYKHISSVGKPPKNFREKPDRIVKSSGLAISVMGNMIYSEEAEINYNTQVSLAKRILNGKANIGVAIGYDKFNFTTNFFGLENEFLSTAIYGRYYLSQKTTRSFVDGKLGYAWALSSIDGEGFTHEYNGEIVSNLGIGFHLPSRNHISLLIRSGVNYLRTSGEFAFNFGNDNRTAYSRRFIHPYLGIALEF